MRITKINNNKAIVHEWFSDKTANYKDKIMNYKKNKKFMKKYKDRLDSIDFSNLELIYFKNYIVTEWLWYNNKTKEQIYIEFNDCDYNHHSTYYDIIISKDTGVPYNEIMVIDKYNQYSIYDINKWWHKKETKYLNIFKKENKFFIRNNIFDINEFLEYFPETLIISNYNRDRNYNNIEYDFNEYKINKDKKYFFPYKLSGFTHIGVNKPNIRNFDSIRYDNKQNIYFSSEYYQYNSVKPSELIEYNEEIHEYNSNPTKLEKGIEIIFINSNNKVVKDKKRTKVKTENNHRIKSINCYIVKGK